MSQQLTHSPGIGFTSQYTHPTLFPTQCQSLIPRSFLPVRRTQTGLRQARRGRLLSMEKHSGQAVCQVQDWFYLLQGGF